MAAQTLFKCVQANGRVLYQQEPCPDAARQSTVRPPDPRAAKTDAELQALAEREAKGAEAAMDQVVQVMADVSLCVNESPGFDAKYGSLIQEWKARNGQQVAKFDADAGARARAVARMDSERARLKAGKGANALAARCEQVAAALRAPAARK